MNTLNATLGPLLSPDELRLSDTDKHAAHAKIDSAARQGVLTAQQAADRRELMDIRKVYGTGPSAVTALAGVRWTRSTHPSVETHA